MEDIPQTPVLAQRPSGIKIDRGDLLYPSNQEDYSTLKVAMKTGLEPSHTVARSSSKIRRSNSRKPSQQQDEPSKPRAAVHVGEEPPTTASNPSTTGSTNKSSHHRRGRYNKSTSFEQTQVSQEPHRPSVGVGDQPPAYKPRRSGSRPRPDERGGDEEPRTTSILPVGDGPPTTNLAATTTTTTTATAPTKPRRTRSRSAPRPDETGDEQPPPPNLAATTTTTTTATTTKPRRPDQRADEPEQLHQLQQQQPPPSLVATKPRRTRSRSVPRPDETGDEQPPPPPPNLAAPPTTTSSTTTIIKPRRSRSAPRPDQRADEQQQQQQQPQPPPQPSLVATKPRRTRSRSVPRPDEEPRTSSIVVGFEPPTSTSTSTAKVSSRRTKPSRLSSKDELLHEQAESAAVARRMGRHEDEDVVKPDSRRSNSSQEPTKPDSRRSNSSQEPAKPDSRRSSSSSQEPTKPDSKRFSSSSQEPAKPDSRRSSSSSQEPIKPDSKRFSSSGDSAKRPNLDRKSLQNMKDLKDSIKQMRSQRRKVKFSESRAASMTAPMPSPTPTETADSTPTANLQGSGSTTLQSSKSTLQSSRSALQSSRSTAASSLMSDFNSSIGELTLDDLDVGFRRKNTTAAADPNVASEEELQIASLQKQIKKTKKLIKRTCRDVWTERDEIVAWQRKNWSLRKGLIQGEAPPDSVTTLNMRIEKLIRQERELDLELDRAEDEKHYLEQDSHVLATAIGEFKDLLDALNTQIVPLLSPSPTPSEEETSTPVTYKVPSKAALSPKAEDALADSIHSTESDEEASLSLSHLRILSPV
jgi:hypothetical protein